LQKDKIATYPQSALSNGQIQVAYPNMMPMPGQDGLGRKRKGSVGSNGNFYNLSRQQYQTLQQRHHESWQQNTMAEFGVRSAHTMG